MENVLKLRRPFMHGPAVKRVQEYLELTDIDGVYGPGTTRAVIAFQTQNGLVADGVVGPNTWKLLKGAPTENHFIGELFDIRKDHPKPRLYARSRAWSEIGGVVLHQTGCDMPNDPAKWKNLNAHIGVTREGLIVWANPFTDFIWHAQKLSRQNIGVEFEGNFPGIIGDSSTLWKGGGPACSLTKAQIMASRTLFELIQQEFRSNGGSWKHIYTHRQSSATRTADPGERIWKEVGLDWTKRLNLVKGDGGSNFKLGKGKPIPKVWDPKRTASYR